MTKSSALLSLVASVALIGSASPLGAQDSPQRGAQTYRVCAACHSLKRGVHLSGPSLADLWGKKSGLVDGFVRYSKALKSANIAWDETTLDAWLADPQAMVPGNYMVFRGIRDNKARGDLIAFLRLALAPGGGQAVVEQRLLRAETAEGQVPEPIASVGPDQQVTAIRHCRDTYFVTTAKGAETAHWELNVRLKTDTGKTGPHPGKPVLLPAGMQGDRVSIIFADPAEIGRLVEKRCAP
jgi:cytochrome c